MSRTSLRVLLAGAVCLSVLCATLILPGLAAAEEVAPHVATEEDTSACAMCHRAHSAPATTEYYSPASEEMTGSALILGDATRGDGDLALCLSCHGVDLLGSSTDVGSDILKDSTHLMTPDASEYGLSPKQCSTCHDSHGTDKKDGSAYPALLRSWEGDTAVFEKEEYCATCHKARAGSRFDGLALYKKTAHFSGIPADAEATLIRCAVCHTAHGSETTPLVSPLITPPAAPATFTVSANDRTFCLGCHPASSATWDGSADYAVSSHGVTTKTVDAIGEWPAPGAERRAGECQACHAVMGKDDGSGDPIAKLAEKPSRALCDECHDADGPAGDDLKSLAYPSGEATRTELFASYAATAYTPNDDRLLAYGRDTTGTAPRDLIGPKRYTTEGISGAVAVGDIDGDFRDDLVVTDPSDAKLRVFSADALAGMSLDTDFGELSIAAPADLVAVADIIDEGGDGLPEIAVVDAAAEELRLYRWDPANTELDLVTGSPLATGTGPSSIAAGDVTGTSFADIVITALGDDTFTVYRDSSGTLTDAGPYATGSEPTGASIGDAWDYGDGDNEIVICNYGAASASVSVFDGAGTEIGSFDDGGPALAQPVDSYIGDALSGIAGDEIVVAMEGGAVAGGLNIFKQVSGGGWTAPVVYNTAAGNNAGSVGVWDVEADGRDEIVLGNAGLWAYDDTRRAASVQVFRQNSDGDGLDTAETQTLWAGGVEVAGAAPALAVGDVGAVVPSRHPVGAVAGAHVSTETASFTRHVECVDCHNTHEATATVAAAPAVYGLMKGAWGVDVTNVNVTTISYSQKQGVDNEYEVCLKCHSGWGSGAPRDIADELNTYNASVHAVEAASADATANPGSFVDGWSNTSVLFCADCHGNSAEASVADGPHTSAQAPLLKDPYLGALAANEDLLCYSCHKYEVYYTGSSDGTAGSASRFYDTSHATYTAGSYTYAIDGKLHAFHAGDRGVGCASCHVSHGSKIEEHLLRSDIGWTHSAPHGGSCDGPCHSAARSYTYTAP